jgi:hypothetical protein
MQANGPAIKAVCVTRRERRAVPSTRDGTFARIESRRKEGMARFLASWYKAAGLYECRGTNELSDWYLVTLQMLYKWALVQCRGTRCQRS